MNKTNKRNFWPHLTLLILTLAVFNKVLFLGQTFFASDILLQYYPTRYFVQKWLNQNIIPLWCPQIFNGFPLLAATQTGVFNPLERIIFTFFSPAFAYNLNVAAHFFLCALGMFALVRHLTKEPLAAILVSVAFVFSGFFFINLLYIYIFTFAYVPFAFLLAYKCMTKKRLVYLGQLVIVISIQFFTGGTQQTFYTLLALAFLMVFYTIKPNEDESNRFTPLLYLLLLILGFVMIAAVQILPTFELIGHSVRSGGVDKNIWLQNSFPLHHFVTILIPHFWGEMYRFGIYKGEWNFIDLNCYLGIVPLILAVVPLFLKKRPPISNFFYFLTVFALIYAMGKYNPLYEFLYYLPVFKSFRYPGRILFLFVFSLAVNAGFGFSAILNKEQPSRLRLALVVITSIWLILAVAIYFCLKGIPELYSIRLHGWYKMNLYFALGLLPLYWAVFRRINKHFLFCLLITVTLLDSLLFGYSYNPTVDRSLLSYQPAMWQQLTTENNNYRIYSQRSLPSFAFRNSVLNKDQNMIKLIKSNIELLQGNTALLSPFNIFNGFDQLAFSKHTIVNVEKQVVKSELKVLPSFLAASSIAYLLRWQTLPLKNLPPSISGQYSSAYGVPRAIPRAYFARDSLTIPSSSLAMNYLNSSMFNPFKQVVLHKKPSLPLTPDKLSAVNQTVKVRLEERGPNQIEMQLNAPADGWLVLNDSFYPGWQAFVDGAETEIYQANLLFRAVQVSKGTHEVNFYYRPTSWYYGAMISLTSLAGLIAMIGYLSFFKRT